MLRKSTRFVVAALAAFAVIGFAGCILSPEEEAPAPQPKPTYKPLTEKENVIYNLMQCYKEHNVDRYDELLHPDYIWYNQTGSDPEFLDRATDVLLTGRMFLAAEHKHPYPTVWLDKLELTIAQPGQWDKLEEFQGAPCDDCWQTTRNYYIMAQTLSGDNQMTYLGNDLVYFIVVGVDKGGTKIYQIRRAEDRQKP